MSYAGAEANRAETGLEGRATGPEDRALSHRGLFPVL